MLAFDGSLLHAGDPLLAGTRYILAAFLLLGNHDEEEENDEGEEEEEIEHRRSDGMDRVKEKHARVGGVSVSEVVSEFSFSFDL